MTLTEKPRGRSAFIVLCIASLLVHLILIFLNSTNNLFYWIPCVCLLLYVAGLHRYYPSVFLIALAYAVITVWSFGQAVEYHAAYRMYLSSHTIFTALSVAAMLVLAGVFAGKTVLLFIKHKRALRVLSVLLSALGIAALSVFAFSAVKTVFTLIEAFGKNMDGTYILQTILGYLPRLLTPLALLLFGIANEIPSINFSLLLGRKEQAATLATRLKTLKAKFDFGLINEAEYLQQRADMIDQI